MRRVETISSHVGFRQYCHLERRGAASIVVLHHEPLNALTTNMRAALLHFFNEADADSATRHIVITGEGDAFSCGIDVSDFAASVAETNASDDNSVPTLQALCNRVEASNKVVIAAVGGIAFSGGLELALAAHYRVALPSSSFCMPEVTMGIVPCGGGTQRLPRLIGVRAALDMIATGRKVSATEAERIGLIDHLIWRNGRSRMNITNGDPVSSLIAGSEVSSHNIVLEAALQFAAVWNVPRRISCSARKLGCALTNWAAFCYSERDLARKAYKGSYFQLQCVNAVRAVTKFSSFEEGLAEERKIFTQTLLSAEAQAVQHLLSSSYAVFSEVLPMLPLDRRAERFRYRFNRLIVVGCGPVAIGIIVMALRRDMCVTLVCENSSECDLALRAIREKLTGDVLKHSSTCIEEHLSYLQLVSFGNDIGAALRDGDIVMDCTVGDLMQKREIFIQLEAICPPHCVLATCCSTVSVGELAACVQRPERVVGMFFAQPVDDVPFLEVVQAEHTGQRALQCAIQAGRLFYKATILSRDASVSVGVRIFSAFLYQALSMLEEGVFPIEIDQVMQRFGFRLGIFALDDLVGLHTSAETFDTLRRQQQQLGSTNMRPCCPKKDVFTLHQALVKMGHVGRAAGRGWHRYESNGLLSVASAWQQRLTECFSCSGKNRAVAPVMRSSPLLHAPQRNRDVELLTLRICSQKNIMRRDISKREIIERLLFSAVNEAGTLLRENVVSRSSAIDVATSFACGFPAWKGGLCYYADKCGLGNVVHRMRIYNKAFGDDMFPPPCDELLRMVASQQTFRSKWL